ncbi:MAG: TolC family protein, partial [Verrucomicrobiota bacterium]|nr:TolC family protein [Verrucomicrobiota bacterium]
MRIELMAGVMTAILMGCATSKKPNPVKLGFEVPNRFGASANAPTTSGWLDDFNSTTLNALVKEAIENNPDLRVTAARLKIAQADVKIAGADRLPKLTATALASRTKRNSASGFKISSSRNNRFSPTLDLAWELDVWGRLADARTAALFDAKEAEANLLAAQLSLAANTAKGWFNVAESELQVKLAEQTYQSYTNNLAVLEEGFQAGLTKALDVRLMRTSVRNAEGALQLRLRERDATRRSLEVLLGRYPKNGIPKNESLPTINKSIPVGLPAQLLIRRPDLVAAQRNYLAAHRRTSAAKKDRLP